MERILDPTRQVFFRIVVSHLHILPSGLSNSIGRTVVSLLSIFPFNASSLDPRQLTLCENRSGKGNDEKSSSPSGMVADFQENRITLFVKRVRSFVAVEG